MNRKMRTILISVTVALGVLFAAYLLTEGRNREVKNTVIAYNEALRIAEYEMKSGLMEKLTSRREFQKIDNYLAYLLKNRKVMIGDITYIDFDAVEIEGEKAEVRTKERWKYYYADPETRKPVSDTYDVIYGNVYYLLKQQGHWVVDDLMSKEIGGKTEG